jgi:RNA polymerase sigma factor (TIGR02999 family)
MSDTLYQQLRRVSGGMMRDERGSHTLSPTALVGAAVERLLETNQTQFNDRAHLLASAALAMRRVLVEHARARNRLKRGGGRGRVSWDDVIHAVATRERPELLLEIDDAISALAKQDARGARLVEMKLFGAMENAEIAAVLGVSVSTVEKDWRFYKPKMLTLMGGGQPQPPLPR